MYRQTPTLRGLLTENPARMDIDGYDAYAWHCGIFKQTLTGGDQMVGYLRVVVQQKTEWVENLIAKIEKRHSIKIGSRPAIFYHTKHFPSLKILLGGHLFDDGRFSEPGRFIILPQYRSVGLAQFAIEGIMALGFSNPLLQTAIIDCQRAHCRMYERNGFRVLASQNDQPCALLLLALHRPMVEKRMPDLEARMRRYRDRGAFVVELGQVDWGALRYLPLVVRRWLRRFWRRVTHH
ncbi:MAG: GNAT family N-acyltransferase [Saprospiraceae bacterium]